MTHNIARTSAIALGMAAFVSLSPLSARADTPAGSNPAPASSATAPSRPRRGPRQPRPLLRSVSRPRPQAGRKLDLMGQRSLSKTARAAIPTATRATMHGGAGIATIARTPSPRPRPEWLAVSPIWVRSPPIHSIASRTMAPAPFACRTGSDARGARRRRGSRRFGRIAEARVELGGMTGEGVFALEERPAFLSRIEAGRPRRARASRSAISYSARSGTG